MSEFMLNRAGLSPLTSMAQERLLNRDATEIAPEAAPVSGGQKSFSETLVGMLQDVNKIQKEADGATQEFAAGKGSLHGVMIAVEKAEISLRALNTVRGKLIEAYQEVLRMPV
jgi:flagellar hook-basal body complex protein FliE